MRKFKDKLFKPAVTPQQAEAESSRSSPQSQSPTVSFPDGVKVLYDNADATVDVCFVHGLTGNRDTTWTAKGQSQPWPQSLLAPQLQSARILTYGYDTYVVTSVASSNRLIDHASNLLNDLTTDRARHHASDRPLIFVAHSLGGLVCKEAILQSRNNPESHIKKIFECTKAIIFMGTPHTGSWMADWARLPASALGMIKSTNKSLLKILETDDQLLESVQVRFLAMIRDLRESGRRLEVTCFFEELPIPVVGKVVSKESATFAGYNPISIHANHGDMVKFSSVEETGFERVHRELSRWEMELRSSDRHGRSSSAETFLSSKRKTIFAVPFDPDPHFVPREVISLSVEDQLKQHRRAVLHGMGGTGKSQMAIAYAYRYYREHPHSPVFWMYAATRSRFVQACQQMARQLQLPGYNDPKTDACELVAEWLGEEENGPWLLIVDSADDANLMLGGNSSGGLGTSMDTPTTPLMDYLPRILGPSRRLLITTRNRSVADALRQSSSTISIGRLSLPEARLLLRRKITQETIWPPDEIVDELLTSLACIPLAITQAAAFINLNVMTIVDYLRVFQTSETERMRQLSVELQDPRRERGFPNSVFRTWELSFNQMRQSVPATATLLAFLAFLDGQSIPLTLVRHTQVTEIDWRQALGTVAGYSFVVVAAADETISIHPLVQASVRYWLEQQHEKESSLEQAVQVLADCFPDGEYSNWAVCQTLLPHAQAVLRHQGRDILSSNSRGHLQYHVSWFLWKSGQYEAAMEYISESYNIFVALYGDDDQTTLDRLTLMASVLQDRGKYEEAEEMNRRALAGREKVLGVNHPDTLTSVDNLALVMQSQGKYEEAKSMHRRALFGREKVLGGDHPDTLASVSNLALVLQSQGNLDEAEQMHRRALAGLEKTLGADHLSALDTVNNLGVLYRDQRYDLSKRDNTGTTSLIWAAHKGHYMLVEVLIKKGADVNAQGGPYGTALQAASVNGHNEIVKMLHEAGANFGTGEAMDELEDDLDSVLSTLIGSFESTSRTEAARDYLSRLFQQDVRLSSLLFTTVNFSSLGQQQLAKILNRYLRIFAHDLIEELQAEKGTANREACKFVWYHSRSLASELSQLSYNGSEPERFASLHAQSKDSGQSELTQRFLDGLDAPSQSAAGEMVKDFATNPAPPSTGEGVYDQAVADYKDDNEGASPGKGKVKIEEDNTGDSSSDSTISDQLDHQSLILEAFLKLFERSDSFVKLVDNLWLDLHPDLFDWRSIDLCWQQEFNEPAPIHLRNLFYDDVRYLHEEVVGLSDKVKFALERFTNQPWDWWPFEPPKRPITAGRIRLKWGLCCGRTQSFDVSPMLAEKVKKYTQVSIEARKDIERSPTSLTRTQSSNHPRTDDRSPGSMPSQAGPSALVPSKSGPSTLPRPQLRPKSSLSSLSSTSSSQNKRRQRQDGFVLLCVRNMSGPNSLKHVQIEVPSDMTDNQFFEEFRRQYRNLRRWFYWLHPDKFWYCHCSRFYKWDVDKVSWEDHEMPKENSYIFNPKPPAMPYRLTISINEWEDRFHQDCSLALRSDFLDRIPKRDKRFEVTTCSTPHQIWGLYAQYRTSARVVLAWSFICISPGILFFIGWLTRFANDLQNASVPIMVIFSLVGLPLGLVTLGAQFKGIQVD